MKVYQGLEEFEKPAFAIVTSGTFDGVHMGHQKILARLREIKEKHQGEIVVITYWPHPRIILAKDAARLKLLNTLEEKKELLARHGVDHLMVLPFTPEFSQLSPEDFIQKVYISGVGTQKLVIGYDHRFGRNREGGFDFLLRHLDRYNFDIEEIPREDIDHVGISSTKIRNALLEGNLSRANTYLGYSYSLRGEVIHGDKLGRTIGFPTANLGLDEPYKLIPGDGIYAVRVKVEHQEYYAMLYIGTRPTLKGQMELRIEANILDFDQDIYGKKMQVFFEEKIRGDQAFASIAEMQLQLKKDEEMTRTFFQI